MLNLYGELPQYSKSVVLIVWHLITILQMGLAIFKLSDSRKLMPALKNILIFFALATVHIALYANFRYSYVTILCSLPVIAIVIIAVAVLADSIYTLVSHYKRMRSSFSSNTIPQAIDNLPLGIFFCDPDGKIILANRKIRELCFAIIGSYPQLLADINGDNLRIRDDVKVLNKAKNIYKLPDGEIWRFKTVLLRDVKLVGYTQTTAQNLTDIYNSNEQLRRNNEELININNELQDMYDRMADAIREKETLDLKAYIHDTMGTSLLTIKEILDADDDNMDDRLSALQNAVSVLSTNHPVFDTNFESVIDNASKLGVKVLLDGYIPNDGALKQLVIFATRECVTNCIRHAKGDEVYVQLDRHMGRHRVIITNNGDKPNGIIKEGSGLSSLRKRVEQEGGEMQIACEPRFSLTIKI